MPNPRCLYDSSFEEFIKNDENLIFGIIDSGAHGVTLTTTKESWQDEIKIMKKVLSALENKNGKIIFEYEIPRLGKRIDVVLLYCGIVFCIEFKTGNQDIEQCHYDQVLDYALDLKNFHKFSQDKLIVPILVDPKFKSYTTNIQMSVYDDRVVNPLLTGENGIYDLITKILDKFPNEAPVNSNWIISPYSPTPTIIEAAKTLYENHSVENITRHEADKVSTDATIKYIIDVIQKSKSNGEKSISFASCPASRRVSGLIYD